MTKQQRMSIQSEEFVKRILVETFGQKTTQAQIREVAKKVLATLPQVKERKLAA